MAFSNLRSKLSTTISQDATSQFTDQFHKKKFRTFHFFNFMTKSQVNFYEDWHWGYSLAKKVDWWHNQFDQGAFSQSNSSSTNYTLVSHVTGLWCHLLSPLSRVSTDSSFILIPCVKIEIPGRGGGDSRPLQHHLCKKSSTYKWLVFIAWINCEIDLGFPRSWTLSTWHYS